jgi:hypothetical protein
VKLPYEYVSKHVELLYQKQFKSHQISEINQWCDFIIGYIELCGWTTEEYIIAMFEELRKKQKPP